MKKLDRASIHGRFQPFHNGHLAYAMASLERADRIYIGLTRVLTSPAIHYENAPHRNDDGANPFTYYQRSQIIRSALTEHGIDNDRIEIGPFPIEEIENISEFWPKNLKCFTTIVDRWNEEKIEKLRSSGFDVEVLKDVAAGWGNVTSGTKIRDMLRKKEEDWKKFVPLGTAKCMIDNQWLLK